MTKKVWLNVRGCNVACFVGVAILAPNYGFPYLYQIIIFVAMFRVYFSLISMCKSGKISIE
ncbi:hypothetical protein DFP96_102320 [Listeria rocourtiae]|uniref:Uncharacterized protein n=1 Tax=Listeria rocourtiae TaxID=647910 RepID=A0A4R6ZQG8_9LIST|nr:hypothetical protein PROCOU_11708 [Listeria rocourtiae FSL F6-920]TDR54725.1 hypothetical protein DFP96_102320 [Listeria rocourtiae]